MSTQRWAEVCKVLQNPSAADTKVNIHHVRTMPVFRKLYSILIGEFTHPEHTHCPFFYQINLLLLQSQSLSWCLHASSSQFLWSPGQMQGFCAGQAKCRELWVPGMTKKRGWEVGMQHCPVQTQSCCNRAGEPSKDLPVISVLPHILLKLMELLGGSSSCAPPVGHRTKGWSKTIPDGSCWCCLWGELNPSLTSQLLCVAKTVSVTVKGEKGHSEGRLKRSKAQTDVFKGWAEWQMPVR